METHSKQTTISKKKPTKCKPHNQLSRSQTCFQLPLVFLLVKDYIVSQQLHKKHPYPHVTKSLISHVQLLIELSVFLLPVDTIKQRNQCKLNKVKASPNKSTRVIFMKSDYRRTFPADLQTEQGEQNPLLSWYNKTEGEGKLEKGKTILEYESRRQMLPMTP